jgi:hypothetical protein
LTASETVPYGSAYGLDNLAAQEALRHAAIVVLDQAICEFGDAWHHSRVEDLAEHHADSEARRVFRRQASHDLNLVWVPGSLPSVYEDRYASFDFLKNWVITLSTVGWKLAQPDALPLANVAEELALHAMIEEAISWTADIAEPPHPEAVEHLRELYDSSFEDTDFLELFDLKDSDDLPDLDPSGQMGMTDLRFKNWFQPFGSGTDRTVPHPFVRD